MTRPKELDDHDRRPDPPQDDYVATPEPDRTLPPPFDGMASRTGRALTSARLHDLEQLVASMPGRERLSFAVGWILGGLTVAIGVYAVR